MKTIKIFLASSEELSTERASLADLVDNLNFKLRSQDLFIQLVKWEYLDSSMGPLHKQEEYNRELKDCELCMVLYWTRFGMYTKAELDTAYQELCAGRNPKKLYVYFKDSEEISPELREFRDSFPEKYNHFYCHFQNVDTLKADFLLQFMEYLNSYMKGKEVIEIRDSQVTINGKVYVNLQNVPFAGNNEEYNLLLKTIKKTRKLLSITEPDDPEYAGYAADLRELEEKQSQMEASLWDTALMVTKLSNTHCSERLQRAMDLFGQGDNKGAQAILNEEEIEKDVQHNLRLIELGEEGRKGIKTNIEEYRLKIKTLENELSEGWKEKALELYEKCVSIGRNNLDEESFAELLSDYGDYLVWQKIYDRVEGVYLESISILKKLAHSKEHENILLWDQIQLSDYYLASSELKKAEGVLKDSLEIIELQNNPKKKADALNHLALLYYEQLDLTAAEELFQKVISMEESQPDDGFRGIIEDSHYYLGLLYERKGDYSLAEKEAHEALRVHMSMIDKVPEEDDYFLCQVYGLLGNCYVQLGRTDEAESAFLKDLSLLDSGNFSTSSKDWYDISRVCCLGNLSRVLAIKNNYEQSIKLATEAYSASKALFDKYPIQYSSYYALAVCELSRRLFENRQYDESVGLLKKAMEVYDHILSTTDDQKYRIDKESCLNLLGCISLENRRYEEAREAFCSAKDLLSEITLSGQIDYSYNMAEVLSNLGYLEAITRNFDKSEAYYREAMAVFLSEDYSVAPEDNVELASLELNIGFLYNRKKDWQNAKAWFSRSLERLRGLKSTWNATKVRELMVQNLINLSSGYGKTAEFEIALKYANEAKELAEMLFHESPAKQKSLYVNALNESAWELFLDRKPLEAENHATESLSLARELGDKNLLRIVIDTNACILREQERYSEAEVLFGEAISICDRLKADDEEQVAKQAYEEKELAKLYEKAGRLSDCKEFITRAKAIFAAVKNESIIQSYAEDIQELEQMSK